MTREELIKCIYDSDEAWSCPNETECEKAENDLLSCRDCAEKQLKEYENQIRADAIDECFDAILNCELELNCNKWHMIQLQEAIEKILQLKEQKNE